jgi:uncharacterized protein YabE (DUF348 family)
MRKRRERERLRKAKEREDLLNDNTAVGGGTVKPKNRPAAKGDNKVSKNIKINMKVLAAVCAVIAAAVLVFMFFYFTLRMNSQIIYLNETKIGTVKLNRRDPFTADYFRDLAIAKLTEEEGTRIITSDTVSVESARTNSNEFVSAAHIVTELRRNMEYLLEAAAIYVDGRQEAAVLNRNIAEDVLWRVKEQFFQDGLDIIHDASAFIEDVQIRLFETDGTGLLNSEQAFITLNREIPHRWSYTVRSGDVASVIANRHGMTLEELAGLNPSRNLERIHPGDILQMVTSRPLLTVITYELRTYVEVIPKPIEYIVLADQPAGFSRVREQGSDGQRRVTAYIIRHNGFEQDEREIIDEEIIIPARTEFIEIGS